MAKKKENGRRKIICGQTYETLNSQSARRARVLCLIWHEASEETAFRINCRGDRDSKRERKRDKTTQSTSGEMEVSQEVVRSKRNLTNNFNKFVQMSGREIAKHMGNRDGREGEEGRYHVLAIISQFIDLPVSCHNVSRFLQGFACLLPSPSPSSQLLTNLLLARCCSCSLQCHDMSTFNTCSLCAQPSPVQPSSALFLWQVFLSSLFFPFFLAGDKNLSLEQNVIESILHFLERMCKGGRGRQAGRESCT